MCPLHHICQNYLLSALPEEEQNRLSSHLELVPLTLGEVIYEPDTQMRHVYFPTNSIVSLLCVMENGSSAEIAVVGNEGIVGVSLFMGGGNHAEPGCCAKCWPCLPAEGSAFEKRIL